MKRINILDLDPGRVQSLLAVDTETSGLYPDAGARISAVSAAWVDTDGWWEGRFGTGQHVWPGGISTIREEVVNPETGSTAVVVSVAYPVDQGVDGTGKPEDTGASPLWPDTENISMAEYTALLNFIEGASAVEGMVLQNGKFDLMMFEAGVRRWPGFENRDFLDLFTWDTQNVSDLLWSMYGKASLKPTLDRVYGAGESDEQKVIQNYLKKQKLPSGRWDLMPWEIIARYADQDARGTLRLALYQAESLEGIKWLRGGEELEPMEAVERRLAVTKMLRRVERRGLPFDVEGSVRTASEISSRVAELKAAAPFQPVTDAMAIHYWFGEGEQRGVKGLGLAPISLTDKGRPQVTQSVVRELASRGVPYAEEWAKLSKLEGANSKWYLGWSSRAGEDGRLRTSVRQNGTISGRFSVENIQLQAIPHDYRLGDVFEGLPSPRTLIAGGVPEDFQLWELDLAQAELRVAALYAKCGPMLELIHEGADLHGETAKQLFSIDPSSSEWGMWRNVAKRGNFSFIFGIGWREFQKSIKDETGIEFSESESKTIVRDWNALFPQYKMAIRKHSDIVVERMKRHGVGWLTMPNGERRWFTRDDAGYDWDGNLSVHKAFNQRVQPSLAQFGIDLWLQSEAYLMDLYGDEPVGDAGRIGMVLMIHDSQVLLLPEGQTEPVDHIVSVGSDLWSRWFPGVPGALEAKKWGSD